MSEAVLADNLEAQDVLRREAEDNMNFFWERQGIEDPLSLRPDDRKIIFDVPLLVYTDELKESRHYPDERNRRVRIFAELGWLPKSAAEVRMVGAEDEEGIFDTQGPDERLRRAKHTGMGEAPRAQKATFETLDSYLQDAKNDRGILIRARTINSEGNAGDIKAIRQDPEVLNVIADYMHGREILDRGLDDDRNTKIFKNRQRYWRGFMQAAVQPGAASDEALLKIYETVWKSAQARTGYWGTQKEAAYKKVGRVLVDDVQETVIPVRIVDEPAAETSEPHVATEADNLRPWENFRPPTPIGGNYQIDGLEEIPIAQKEDEHAEDGTARPVAQAGIEPAKQLFSTAKMDKESQRAKQKSRRPKITRSQLSPGGREIADDDKEVEFNRRAAEGRL